MPTKDEPSRKGVEHTGTTPDMGGGQQGQNFHRDKLRRQNEADRTPSAPPGKPPTPGPDPISGGQYERGTGEGTRPDKA